MEESGNKKMIGNEYKESAYTFYHNNSIDITKIISSSLLAQEKVDLIMQSIIDTKLKIAEKHSKITEYYSNNSKK